LVYGTGRLIDNNEGVNVKSSFYGGRIRAKTAELRLDVFAVKPIEQNTGTFDDRPSSQQTFWGNQHERIALAGGLGHRVQRFQLTGEPVRYSRAYVLPVYFFFATLPFRTAARTAASRSRYHKSVALHSAASCPAP
jgi:hypothetical protein